MGISAPGDSEASTRMDYEPGWTFQGSYGVVPTEPLEVGNRRQLLMDRYVVEDVCECRRVVHQPERHSANPLITCEADELETDSREHLGPFRFVSAAHDAEQEVYRMWALCSILRGDRSRMTHYDQMFARYYESADGVRWEVPELNLFQVEGVSGRNIFLADELRTVAPSVTELPPSWRHKGRYLMVYDNGMMGRRNFPDLDADGQRQQIAFSDDGIHWRDQEENPVFAGQSDTDNNICYNPERGVFMLYRRAPVNAGEIRRIAYSESADLIHWTQPTQIVHRDELDPCSLYGMVVMRYCGVYLGFLQMFYYREPMMPTAKPDKHMQIDCQLAWSRDGIHWERHPQRPIFFPNGSVGSYDWGIVYPGKGLIEREDRVDFYYAAQEALHIPMPTRTHICLASLRTDGFVSVEAPGRGRLLTRPMRCPGGRLHINARTREGGSIAVVIRRGDGEMDGQPPATWPQPVSAEFAGDSMDHVIGWAGDSNLDPLKDHAIRLEFRLQRSEIFSFWFDGQASQRD